MRILPVSSALRRSARWRAFWAKPLWLLGRHHMKRFMDDPIKFRGLLECANRSDALEVIERAKLDLFLIFGE
jgi:hypothetical protein